MTAHTTALRARNNTVLETLARLGFAAYGVVYLLLAWLTVQLLLAHRNKGVSRRGALHELARQPLGTTLLWIACGGFAALVLWQVCGAVAGHAQRRGAERWLVPVMSAFRAIVFATLAFTTARIASGPRSGGSGGSEGAKGWTAQVMSWPLGPVLVGAVGVAIVAYAGWSVFKGLTDRWRKELEPDGKSGNIGTAVTALARVGYAGRGVAFAAIGGFIVWAALTHDPKHSGGLDTALERLREAPFGMALLGLIALGFACFGAFNLAKARYLRPTPS